MAQRRMFSKAIVNSARFLRMPQTSRLLYYDLGMSADDEGVVEAFTVLRTTGAAEEDLRILASKGFVVVLNEELVTYITDWTINNQIRKDRFSPSIYGELLVRISDGNQAASTGLPDGSQAATQYSIGQVSIGEDRKEEEKADKLPARPRFSPPSLDEVREYCTERGNGIDEERFVDFYDANGWKVGKNPMKDWEAAVRTWERRKNDGTQQRCANTSSSPGKQFNVHYDVCGDPGGL